jgi:hypothetical protein
MRFEIKKYPLQRVIATIFTPTPVYLINTKVNQYDYQGIKWIKRTGEFTGAIQIQIMGLC